MASLICLSFPTMHHKLMHLSTFFFFSNRHERRPGGSTAGTFSTVEKKSHIQPMLNSAQFMISTQKHCARQKLLNFDEWAGV